MPAVRAGHTVGLENLHYRPIQEGTAALRPTTYSSSSTDYDSRPPPHSTQLPLPSYYNPLAVRESLAPSAASAVVLLAILSSSALVVSVLATAAAVAVASAYIIRILYASGLLAPNNRTTIRSPNRPTSSSAKDTRTSYIRRLGATAYSRGCKARRYL